MTDPESPRIVISARPGKFVVIAGAVVAVIGGFLPWYRVRFDFIDFTVTRNGFESPDAGLSVFAIAFCVAAAAFAVVDLALTSSSGGRRSLQPAVFTPGVLGAIAIVMVAAKYANESKYASIGFVVTGLGAAAVVIGGIVMIAMREEVEVAVDPAEVPRMSAHMSPGGAMYCEQCGNRLTPDARFCASCGAAVRVPAPPPEVWAGPDSGTLPPPPSVAPPPPPPPPAAWGTYAGPYGAAPPTRTNGFAIASMVLGILWIYWIGSILALVFGYIAKNQIDNSRGSQSGRGMAIAGIVLGWVGIAAIVLVVIAVAADSS
jgi:hypothetical protein